MTLLLVLLLMLGSDWMGYYGMLIVAVITIKRLSWMTRSPGHTLQRILERLHEMTLITNVIEKLLRCMFRYELTLHRYSNLPSI